MFLYLSTFPFLMFWGYWVCLPLGSGEIVGLVALVWKSGMWILLFNGIWIELGSLYICFVPYDKLNTQVQNETAFWVDLLLQKWQKDHLTPLFRCSLWILEMTEGKKDKGFGFSNFYLTNGTEFDDKGSFWNIIWLFFKPSCGTEHVALCL